MADTDVAPLVLPPPTAPMDVAKVFVVQHFAQGEALTLHYWRGSWWQWVGTHWAERARDWIDARLYEFTDGAIYYKRNSEGEVEKMPWLPNRRRVADVYDAMKVVCETPAEISPPCWLDGRVSGRVVPCSNGLLDLDVETRTLTPHTPMFFNLTSLPYGYDAAAKCPTFDAFLNDLWGDDEETRRAVGEAFGCAVANKLDLHRIPVCVGPPRSGKSTIQTVLTALVGVENAASPSLRGMADDKVLVSLIGKSLCTIPDIRSAGKSQEVAETLLKISGQDRVTIDRKYKDPWTGELSVLIVMFSNELTQIRDASGALAKRLLPLMLTKTFEGVEKRDMAKRLLAELPGILNWSLHGYDRVVEKGRFTEPAASREAMEEIADAASPMRRYVAERLDVMPEGGNPDEYRTDRDVLYDDFKPWNAQEGEPFIGKAVFGQRLRAVLPHLRRSQPGGRAGPRTSMYVGVRLRGPRARFPTPDTTAVEAWMRRTGGRGPI